jgi:hypothetical protein
MSSVPTTLNMQVTADAGEGRRLSLLRFMIAIAIE